MSDPSVSERDGVLLSDLISSEELALSNVTLTFAFCCPTPPEQVVSFRILVMVVPHGTI